MKDGNLVFLALRRAAERRREASPAFSWREGLGVVLAVMAMVTLILVLPP